MFGSAEGWLARVPPIDLALASAVAVAVVLALLAGRRGGQFRALPGWGGFWIVFATVLVCLSRAERWIAFAMLAVLMFAALRTYFFVAPVRPRDRYAILAAYLAIPVALWPAYTGHHDTFLATVPVALFLVIPVFLAIGRVEAGLLDSMGRTLLGVLFFVYCVAHLGLISRPDQSGLLELFGILVLASELPQRLAGSFSRERWGRATLGVVLGVLLAAWIGWELGPWCGLVEEDGARAGLLVVMAVTLGGQVSNAVAKELALGSASSRLGRGAVLNRMVPAVYAAPVFFHYLNHFV